MEDQRTVIVNQAPKNGSGTAVTSMIFGILSIAFCCCGMCISVILGVIGLAFGIVSVVQNHSDRNMAIAGIVMSSIGIVFGIVMTILIFVSGAIS